MICSKTWVVAIQAIHYLDDNPVFDHEKTFLSPLISKARDK